MGKNVTKSDINAIGERLKELRLKRKLTQAELAGVLKKNCSTIAGYESEGKEPDFETLVLIADFFDVSVDYLLGKNDNKKNHITSDIIITPERAKILHQ